MSLVSVVMCTYRRPQLLPRAVESVMAQTHRPLELVLTDDGSEDDTGRVMRELAKKCEAAGVSANFATKVNGGVASARNAGLGRARGDWVAFLDDDDTWQPQKISKQMAELERGGAEACCCQFLQVRENDERHMPLSPDQLLRGRGPSGYLSRSADAHINSIIVKAEIARRVGPFDEALRVYEDFDWIVRLLCEADFACVPEVLGRYEYTAGSLFKFSGYEQLLARDEMQERAVVGVREKCRAKPSWDDSAWHTRLAQDFDQFIKHRLYAGELDAARRLLERALLLGAPPALLKGARRKMRKAWWLSLVGLRLKHPKFGHIAQVKG